MKFWNNKLSFKQLKVKLLLSIVALFLSSSISAQIITLGSGTTVTGTSTASPINVFYESLRCQIVYTKAEINAAGVVGASDLNRLGFYIATAPNVPMPNWTVKMKHTTAANVAAHDGAGLSTHLVIPSYMPVAGGFQMLTLTTPFNWNGVDNILIDICFEPVSNWSSSGTVRYYTLANGFRYVRADGTSQCGVNTNTTATNKPQIQMDFAAPFPMVYDSVQAVHPTISSVLNGTNNNVILQAKVKTTGGLSPFDASSLTFTTNGSTNPTGDLTNASLYYTGSSDIFSTATQFGTSVANPNGNMTFNGTVTLNSGFSYFWLVYDVPATATAGNVLDATLTSITVDNIVRTPSNSAPNGNRPIVNLYANIPHVEGFEGTWLNGSGTRDLPSIHWKNTPSTDDESWRRDDDGASASWSSTGGTFTPSGSNANNAVSSHAARFHSYDVQANTSGTLDLYLNFSPAGIKVLDFDIINASGNDKLEILFSDNAGATFTPIGTSYGTHANWTRYKNITLSSTTSLTCILRFKGTGDWGVSDIGLDNIYVRVPPPFDAGVVNTNSSLCDGHVNVLIQNYGSQPITGFDVSYVLNSVVTTENVGSLTIQPNQQATYSFAASVVGPGPHNIQSYTILTSDGLALNDTSAVAICYNKPLVSTFPYFMDFESGQNGWNSGGTLNSWAFGKPAKATINTAASGTKSWVTNLTGQHNNNENSYVLSPCFDFSALNNPIIKLKVWWESEGSFDGAALQASTDGGLSWTTIGDDNDPMNWYNDNSISGNPGGQQMGWTGQTGGFSFVGSGGWVLAQHKLDGLANQPSVSLRIVFGAEGSGVDDGFAFDDVYIGEGPVANLPDQVVLCAGDTVTLDPGSFASYNWIPTNDSIRFLPVSSPGFYIVKVADADGFTDSDTIEVIGSVFTVELGPKKFKCPTDTINITTNLFGFDYLWNDGSTNPDINVSNAGFYSVIVTDQFGCQRKDTVEVAYFALPAITLGSDTTICGNTFVEMNAGNAFPGSTYLWSTGDTTQRLLVTAPGTYTVKVTTVEGCSVMDSVKINNIPSPVLNLGADISQCTNLNVNLDAGNPGCTYLWSTNATTRTINVTQAGVYSVKVTNSNGCFVNDTIVVGFDPAASVSLGPDVQSCTPVTLDAGVNSAFYIWSTGESTSTIMATTSGTYVVQVGTPQGCVALDTIQVTIFPGLNAAIAVLDTVYVQDTVQFADATFPIPTVWNWSFGDNSTSTLNNPTHVYDSVGTYSISLQVSKNGCTDTVTKDVVVVVRPVAVDPMQNLISFVLYPNPNRGQFRVQAEWSQFENGQIIISDLSGKTVDVKVFENQVSVNQDFNVSHLPAGYYFLTLQTNKGRITTKVVLY